MLIIYHINCFALDALFTPTLRLTANENHITHGEWINAIIDMLASPNNGILKVLDSPPHSGRNSDMKFNMLSICQYILLRSHGKRIHCLPYPIYKIFSVLHAICVSSKSAERPLVKRRSCIRLNEATSSIISLPMKQDLKFFRPIPQ